FTTDVQMSLVKPRLRHLVLARSVDTPGAADGYTHEDLSADLANEVARRRLGAPVFQRRPRPGDAFYLGFPDNMAGHVLLLRFDSDDLTATLGAPGINQDDPPLRWEFWQPSDAPRVDGAAGPPPSAAKRAGSWVLLEPPAETIARLRKLDQEL